MESEMKQKKLMVFRLTIKLCLINCVLYSQNSLLVEAVRKKKYKLWALDIENEEH